ncbi:hypothetical protein BBP40_010888 [Aspergillus hancockii]|nr:hypothetical protein BBP40_010888 [Aspergillus hancockii]
MADELPVLIIGAGISGLILAQYLQTAGVPFQIFERDSAVDARSGGWGLTLHWALPALRHLLPEDLVAQLPETYVNKEAAARGDAGRYQFFDLKSGEALSNVPAAERIRVSRVRLRPGKTPRALRELLFPFLSINTATSHLEQQQWNKALKDIESTPDSVAAHFEDGTSCKGRLLVSCDGSRSPSRQILYPDHKMNPLPVQLLGATALYTPEQMHGAQKIDPFIFQGAHPDTDVYLFFSLLDTPNNFEDSTDKYYCQLIVSWADAKGIKVPATSAERIALMKSLTANWAHPFRSLIHQLPDDTEALSIRIADWIFDPSVERGHPRVVLVGDSAHTMTMFRGEGANNAIVDVEDLVKRVDFKSAELDALRSSIAAFEKDMFARAEASVLNSRQACLDAHDFQTILNGSPPEDVNPLKGSPPRRRLTRSQSRELEAREQDVPVGKSSLQSRKKWGQNKGRMSGQGLSVVAEESPLKSPRKSGYRAGQEIPESPEDAHNISGTTILPSEPENDLDPDMMLEVLPDLERAATAVLDFLVPASVDPVSIVNMAKRLADPRNTQSKRLERSKTKLKNEAKYFGGKTYIDVSQASELILVRLVSKDGGVEPDFNPEPVLQRANCARFALDVLLASGNSNAFKQAIRNVERLFPLPFMSDLTDGQRDAVGQSALEQATFELALEIRTQSLLMQLEEHQHDRDFDPHAILRDGFYLDVSADETFASSDAPLRGFSLDNLGGADGYLPTRFRDVAYDRFNEMRVMLPQDEDGYFDIEELTSTYRWQRFLLRAAKWVRRRCEEINEDLEGQQRAEDMRDEYFAEPQVKDRRSLSSMADLSAFRAEERSQHDSISSANNRQDPTIPPEPRREIPTVSEPAEPRGRRKSGKPSLLSRSNVEILAQREQKLRALAKNPEARRQSDVIARQASQPDREESDSQLRRQTLPASLQSRQAPPEETTEAPASREASREPSPALLHDEQDFTLDSGSELFVGERSQLEKSHSPVMSRVSREPRQTVSPIRMNFAPEPRRETVSTQASSPPRTFPSNEEMWKAAMGGGSSSRSAKKPEQSSRAAFIDRQTHAHRVSPISQATDPQSVERRRAELQSKKRRRHDSEDEPESDDDFTNYHRSVDVARKRAEKPAQPPQAKRPRVEENNEDAPAAQLLDGLQETTRSTAVPESPEARQETTNAVPVSSSARHTVTSTKAPMRWTPAEDARLIRLIEENGLGKFKGQNWNKIESQNEAQPEREGETRIDGRSQVQLKDRARNLKIKYLRERKPLPRYFEHVTMKEKDYAMLEKRGIQVSRGGPREQPEE